MSAGGESKGHWLTHWGPLIGIVITSITAIVVVVIQVSDDPGGSTGSEPPIATTPTESPAGGAEGEIDANGEAAGEGGEARRSDEDGTVAGEPPPETVRTGDGSSRLEPKLLQPNRRRLESIDSSNDVDWFVYEVTEDQTATIEVVKGENPPDREAAGVALDIWEGNTLIDGNAGAWPDKPLVVPHGATRGVPLYIQVVDECGSGCSIGEYSIEVRSAPPG